MAERIDYLNRIARNDTSLKILEAAIIDLPGEQEAVLKDDLAFYILDMNWIDLMARLEELLRQWDHGVMTEQQRQRLEELLVKLEKVKPIVEKLKLSWYRSPPPEKIGFPA